MLEWLTIREVCEETKLSDATVRRYLRLHNRFIKIKKEGNMTVVSPDSIETIMKIRQLYDRGWTKERVDKALEVTEPMSIVVSDGQQSYLLGEYLGDLKKVIAEMAKNQSEQTKMNQKLQEEIQELKEELKRRDEAQFSQFGMISTQLSRVEKYAKQKGLLYRLFKRNKD